MWVIFSLTFFFLEDIFTYLVELFVSVEAPRVSMTLDKWLAREQNRFYILCEMEMWSVEGI
jgi:hypothetical protein